MANTQTKQVLTYVVKGAHGVPAYRKRITGRMLTDARAWLYDCFEDAPSKLGDREVVEAIRRHYAGGWEQFESDARVSMVAAANDWLGDDFDY